MSNVQVVVYMVGLSDYDKITKDNVKWIEETVEIFKVTCIGEWFSNTPILLVFNKYDEYEKSYKKSKFKEIFENFEGNSIEDSIEFLQNLFIKSVKHHNIKCIQCSLNEDSSIYYIIEMIKRFEKFEYLFPKLGKDSAKTEPKKGGSDFQSEVVII